MENTYFDGMKILHEGKYLAVYLPSHHLASKKGTVYIHRLVAERKLNRPLLKTEYVHHIDGDKYNNDEENLLVFRSVADHSAYHNGCCIMLLNDVWIALVKKSIKPSICPLCGNEMKTTASTCQSCYKKLKASHIPDSETLKKLLKEYSYEKIGTMYGITGKAVRKWCDKYNIRKQTVYEIPSKEILINQLLNNSRKKVARLYGVSDGVVENWERKYEIQFTSDSRVKCIELNRIFENKKEAAINVYPEYFWKTAVNNIRKSCKNGDAYINYHWIEIPKELIE